MFYSYDLITLPSNFKREEECAVVQEIMRQCQHTVEQQLVIKGNDIRRVGTNYCHVWCDATSHSWGIKRDIIIKNLESRVKSLEALLAKQLDSKARQDRNIVKGVTDYHDLTHLFTRLRLTPQRGFQHAH